MANWTVVLVVSALCFTVADCSLLHVKDGGYHQLTISFGHNVPPPNNCSRLLDNLEGVVREWSRLLHEATGGRLYVGSVDVVVPQSWNDAGDDCRRVRNVAPTQLADYADADVRVGVSHPLFGDVPFTQQSRDCAHQGDFISISDAFFDDAVGANITDMWIHGRRMLHEWAKYRYGVFDEPKQGDGADADDGFFPTFFCPPTLATLDALRNATIHVPNVNIGQRLGCSAGECHHNQLAPSVETAFCDASVHDDMAPTQQNLLCLGRSVHDVIFDHVDLSTNGAAVNRLPTVFRYHQPRQPRYILALDRSSPMDERDNWKYVRSATRRLVLHDLADETELGVLSFAAGGSVTIHTQDVANLSLAGSRERVASQIPVYLRDAVTSVQESCLTCAVHSALTMLERGGKSASGDVILIITSGSSSANDVASALAVAQRKHVHISLVAFAYSQQLGSLRHLQTLSDATGGLMTTVASKGVGTMSHISMLIQLGDALIASLHHHQKMFTRNVPVLIHEEEFGESANGWVNGSFYLDPSLGRDTVLAVYFYSRDLNTLVGDIHLTAPDGVQHRGISETSMASLYVTPLTAIEKSGVWMYSFDRRSISHQSHFVKVTSKSRLRSSMPHYQRGPISAQLKIVAPVERDAPFILLATVKSGEMPVLDARVRATIQFTGGESNQDSSNTVVIDLLDNGNSDPDITKGDGVYSRYFGKYFRGAGTYSVSLSVDAMNGMAYTIRPYPIATATSAIQCCGSFIHVPQERRELTGAFTRIIPSGILSVVAGHSTSLTNSSSSSGNNWPNNEQLNFNLDVVPPSRVTDLKVQLDPVTQKVNFRWTAVGDDYDDGTAFAYELRITDNKTMLNAESFFLAELLPNAATQPSGESMQLNVDFIRFDRWYYAAVRAIDRSGNHGRISNRVKLWMPSPPTTSTSWPSTQSSGVNGAPPQWFSGGLSTVHWIAIIASIFFAVLVFIIAIYFVVSSKRQKEKEVKSPPQFAYAPSVTSTLYPSEKEVASSTSPSPASHDKEMLSQYKSAITIYDGRTVPVHWSASQLLQEHERRHSPYDTEPFHNDSTHADNVSRGSGPFSGSYHLSSGSATYGMADADAAGGHLYSNNAASSTPPSDYRPYSIEYEGSSVEHDNYTPMMAHSATSNNSSSNNNNNSSKPGRPPTFPKPTSVARLHGSFSSLASERKKQRNVTQV